MFINNGKLEVLESKLNIYEELSKEMLDKLERAVTSIQDGNQKVAIILERHEGRLEEGERSNQAILQLINKLDSNLASLEKKVDENQKMLWMVTWSAAVVIGILQILPLVGLQLTPVEKASMMESSGIHRIV